MKLIFGISQNYLYALRDEAKRFNFNIFGYSTVKEARQNLYKRNIEDILGFVYLDDKLPRKLKEFIEFIQYIDTVVEKGKMFIICLNNLSGLDLLKSNLQINNLDIKVTPRWEALTDIVVRNCFAPIVLSKYTPYMDTDIGSRVVLSTPPNLLGVSSDTLAYNKLIEQGLVEVMKPIAIYGTYEETRSYDTVMQELASDVKNLPFYKARDCRIKSLFGINFSLKDLKNTLSKACKNLILVDCIVNSLKTGDGKYEEY